MQKIILTICVREKNKAANIYFAHRIFLGFILCLLLPLLEEKTKKAKQSHFLKDGNQNVLNIFFKT